MFTQGARGVTAGAERPLHELALQPRGPACPPEPSHRQHPLQQTGGRREDRLRSLPGRSGSGEAHRYRVHQAPSHPSLPRYPPFLLSYISFLSF